MMKFTSAFAPGIIPLVALAYLLFPLHQTLAQDSNQESPTDVPPARVKVDRVIEEEVARTTSVIGRLVERQSGVIAARVSGPVTSLPVQVGDRVKAGDILGHLAPDLFETARDLASAEVLERSAGVKISEARLALTRQELKRLEGLKKSPAFSQARFEDKNLEVARAVGELAQAKASLTRARANFKMAQINLHRTRFYAPYPGVVTQRHTVEGAYLNPGDPVVSMVNDHNLEIEADVPAAHLKGLRPGMNVTFYLENEGENKKTYPAIVRAVIPDENPRTRTRAVRFSLTSDGVSGEETESLAANQSLVLNLPSTKTRQALTVHKDAIILNPRGNMVYMANDGHAQIRPVHLGDAFGNRFEVLGGLSKGEQVVIRGNERLQPGQTLLYDTMN